MTQPSQDQIETIPAGSALSHNESPEEAAAKALAGNVAMNSQPWEQMPEYLRDGYRRAAVAALDAARPKLLTVLLDLVDSAIAAPPLPGTTGNDPEYVDGYHDGAAHAVRVIAGFRSQIGRESS